MDSGPAPFSCAWSVPVMSVLRDAERLAGAQSWSTVWLGWRAVRLGHRAGWAGAQSWLGCWLGWGTGLVGLEQWSTELVRLLVRLGHRAG